MKPLVAVYWLRLFFGLIAGLLSSVYELAVGEIAQPFHADSLSIFRGVSIALLVYLVSYYAVKAKYNAQVTKPQKLFTVGIGIYLLAWIVVWIMIYTMLLGPPLPT